VLAFAGTRSMDLMSMAIRLAGFELRDSIGYANDGGGAPLLAWTFGSGFPKSHDVSKAIDREAGADREVVLSVKAGRSGSEDETQSGGRNYRHGDDRSITAPATEAARQWQGWGTALKPAWEPIILGRKPLGSGTVASNVLLYGTGALNIDGCRVGGDAGRWPANLIHDGSPEVLAGFPVTTSGGKAAGVYSNSGKRGGIMGETVERVATNSFVGDTGSAARFFYCAKASKRDRDEGLEGFALSAGTTSSMTSRAERERGIPREESAGARNHHPTVKPTNLMAYLVRLVTPPGGTVLDPFMGSGSTGKAAIREGFRFIGCELSPEYLAIAEARITHEVAKIEAARAPAAPAPQPDLFATP